MNLPPLPQGPKDLNKTWVLNVGGNKNPRTGRGGVKDFIFLFAERVAGSTG